MQIIIEMSDAVYQSIKDHKYLNEHGVIREIVLNGTPLPKGHGRLKDTDAICKDIISALGIRDENYLLEAEEAIYKRIKNAPTIIEADIPTMYYPQVEGITPTIISSNGSEMLSAEEIDNLLQALAEGKSEDKE